MNRYSFIRSSYGRVRVFDLKDNTSKIVSMEEAQKLGYKNFTYQGQDLSISEFAKKVGKSPNAVITLVRRHGFNTGEDVLACYRGEYKQTPLIYQGRPITYREFSRLIGTTPTTIRHFVIKYNIKTGEDYIALWNIRGNHSRLSLTYGTTRVSYRRAVEILKHEMDITVTRQRLDALARRHHYTSVEEILRHYQGVKPASQPGRRKGSGTVPYKMKLVTYEELAHMLGIKANTLYYSMKNHGFTTGEQAERYYFKKKHKKVLLGFFQRYLCIA